MVMFMVMKVVGQVNDVDHDVNPFARKTIDIKRRELREGASLLEVDPCYIVKEETQYSVNTLQSTHQWEHILVASGKQTRLTKELLSNCNSIEWQVAAQQDYSSMVKLFPTKGNHIDAKAVHELLCSMVEELGKPIAARRSGVKTIIFPLANKKDFDEPAPNVKEGL
ncbi:syntaxin-61-like protein isoform X1 [Tanacetum coccineum]